MNVLAKATNPTSLQAKGQSAAQSGTQGETVTIQLPKDISVGSVVKHTARIIPGTLSLAWQAPKVIGSPIVNTLRPKYYSSDRKANERIGEVLGGAIIGATAMATLAPGGIAGNAALGALMGGLGGLAKVCVSALGGAMGITSSSEALPGVGEAAYNSIQNNSGAYGKGKALRTGFGNGVKDAYLSGGKVADGGVDFMRGLVGFQPAT